jgi:hypothetical protein
MGVKQSAGTIPPRPPEGTPGDHWFPQLREDPGAAGPRTGRGPVLREFIYDVTFAQIAQAKPETATVDSL